MSISINRNMPPKHRTPKQEGGTSYVPRTVEVTIDTLADITGTTTSIPLFGTRGFGLYIPMTNLAQQLGFLNFDYNDYYDTYANSIKPMPFLITSINVGANEASGSTRLVNVGVSHRITYMPNFDDLAIWVKLYELNTSQTIVPTLSDLFNKTFQIQVIHEQIAAVQGYTPVVYVNWSALKYSST